MEVFWSSSVEQELFKNTENLLRYSNLSCKGMRAVRSLTDDRSIVIIKADNDSAVVVWDRDDYVKESQKELANKTVYRKVNYNEKVLSV